MQKYIKDAVDSAQKLIEDYKLSFPVDFDEVKKKLNIKIEKIKFEDNISGLVKKVGKEGIPVIAVNSTHLEPRQRFTIAHEVGHLRLHAIYPVHVDPENIYYRDEKSSKATSVKEIQANAFAAELLMPTVQIKKDVKAYLENHKLDPVDFIGVMAKNYKVSPTAMSIRLGKYLEDNNFN